MVSNSETAENKPVFKKRALRPWKPVIELDPSRHTESTHDSDSDQTKAFSNEILHKPLENTLEIKTKQYEDIQATLSVLENNRITLGGFFKPKNVLFLDEQESSEQTFYLLNALKDREYEIADIQHQIKLAELVAQNQQASMELTAAQQAQHVAEDRLQSIQWMLHQAEERKQSLEESLTIAEQSKNKLEHRALQLEKLLKENAQNFEIELQTKNLETEKLEDIKQFEINLRKQREQELQKIQTEHQDLEAKLHETTNSYQALLTLFEDSQAHLQTTLLENHRFERNLMLASEKFNQTYQALLSEKDSNAKLEMQYQQVKTEKLELQASAGKTVSLLEHIQKIQDILEGERNLRQCLEAQTQRQAEKIASLEFRIKIQESENTNDTLNLSEFLETIIAEK